MTASEDHEKSVRRDMQYQIDSYGLDARNVFGEVADTDEVVTTPVAAAPATTAVQPTTVTIGAREYIYNPDGSITTTAGQVVTPGGALANRITRQIADSIIGGAE